jgi:hypothetical protein
VLAAGASDGGAVAAGTAALEASTALDASAEAVAAPAGAAPELLRVFDARPLAAFF